MKLGPVRMAGKLNKGSLDIIPISNVQGENLSPLVFKVRTTTLNNSSRCKYKHDNI